MAKVLWQDLSTDQFESFDPERTVALLPVGAIEPHGPHLPLSTDATIAEELTHRAATLVPDDVPLLVLPTQHIGKSTEHLQFDGVLTHSAETLLKSWMEIGESVNRAGIKKLVFFNAHGGQPQIMEICCRELRIKYDMVVVGASGWSFGKPDLEDVPEDERKFGIHAGQVETSMMLYLRPDLVKMDKAERYEGLLAEVEDRFKWLRVIGSTYMGWQAQDLHKCGCSGDATLANAKIGELYCNHYIEAMAAMLQEVSEYPLEWIRNREDWS